MPAKDVIPTNQINIVSYPNVKEANTTHKTSQLGSVVANRNQLLAWDQFIFSHL